VRKRYIESDITATLKSRASRLEAHLQEFTKGKGPYIHACMHNVVCFVFVQHVRFVLGSIGSIDVHPFSSIVSAKIKTATFRYH
jgi:hypothetical protein